MGIEGFSSGKWPGLAKRGSFSHSKRYKDGKLLQSTEAASRRKLILLHDWWLDKADSDSGGKQLGIGGYTLKENQGIRCFSSAYILKRHDAVTLETVDGITLMLHGYLNRARTLENGFSEEVCDDFLIGFPYYWEEFVSEDSSASKVVSPSDAYKTPAQENRESKTSSQKSFDANMAEAASSLKRETRVPKQSTDSGGPFTRSRARFPVTRSRARLLNAPNYLQID